VPAAAAAASHHEITLSSCARCTSNLSCRATTTLRLGETGLFRSHHDRQPPVGCSGYTPRTGSPDHRTVTIFKRGLVDLVASRQIECPKEAQIFVRSRSTCLAHPCSCSPDRHSVGARRRMGTPRCACATRKGPSTKRATRKGPSTKRYTASESLWNLAEEDGCLRTHRSCSWTRGKRRWREHIRYCVQQH